MFAKPFLTVPEVARLLGRTPSRCYQLARAGALPVVEIGGRLVVPSEALDAWVREQAARALAAVRHDLRMGRTLRRRGLKTPARRETER